MHSSNAETEKLRHVQHNHLETIYRVLHDRKTPPRVGFRVLEDERTGENRMQDWDTKDCINTEDSNNSVDDQGGSQSKKFYGSHYCRDTSY